MNLDDYLRVDVGSTRFLMRSGEASVTLRPEEVAAYVALYEGLAFHLAGPIALMRPEVVSRWEGLARIICDFRQLGFFTAHLPVAQIERRIIEKLVELFRGEPIDPDVAENIMCHVFMARVEALNRGGVSAPETVQ